MVSSVVMEPSTIPHRTPTGKVEVQSINLALQPRGLPGRRLRRQLPIFPLIYNCSSSDVAAGDTIVKLSVASKLDANWEFLTSLRDTGRERAEQWLRRAFRPHGFRIHRRSPGCLYVTAVTAVHNGSFRRRPGVCGRSNE